MKTLREALRSSDFTLTAELALSPKLNAAQIVEQARELSSLVDAIHIPDHRNARPHMSNIAVAAHLLASGLDPIVHMNTRDRNRIAIQSDLLGAQSLGVSNLLLMRGRALASDIRPPSSSIFDLGAIDLIRTASAIRDGDALAGGRLPDGPDFFIGTVATVFKAAEDWEPEKLASKAEAGAQFVQTQVCMNFGTLRDYLARLVTAKLTWRFQVLAELAVFGSADDARNFRKNLPESIIPPDVVQRLEDAADPADEGVRICAEQLQQLAELPGVSGATLIPAGDPALVLAAIDRSGLRKE